jgi:hypothetical protein
MKLRALLLVALGLVVVIKGPACVRRARAVAQLRQSGTAAGAAGDAPAPARVR